MTNLVSIFFTLLIFFITYSNVFINTVQEGINSNNEISKISHTLYQEQKLPTNNTANENLNKYISEETTTVKLFNSKQKIFSKIQSKF